MISAAKTFADNAHFGQVRKVTGEPYISHPLAVADIVAGVTDNVVTIVAAILHDTVEDTDITLADIHVQFGTGVAQLVGEVTNISTVFDGNRAARKSLDLLHIAKASSEGKTIKLADVIHNLSNLVIVDANFAKVYMAEKKALLQVLVEGNEVLFNRASLIIDDYYRSVNSDFMLNTASI